MQTESKKIAVTTGTSNLAFRYNPLIEPPGSHSGIFLP
jgi:hypothetical protein